MENRTRGKHERQDPYTPHFSCRKTGNTPLCPQAASSYLQPIQAKQLFIYFFGIFKTTSRDGPASCSRPPGPGPCLRLHPEAPGFGGPVLVEKPVSGPVVGRQT